MPMKYRETRLPDQPLGIGNEILVTIEGVHFTACIEQAPVDPLTVAGFHQHVFYEVFFPHGGLAQILFDNQQLTIGEDDLCVVPVGCEHQMWYEDTTMKKSLLCFMYTDDGVNRRNAFYKLINSVLTKITTPLVFLCDPQVKIYADLLFEELKNRENMSQLRIDALFAVILTHLINRLTERLGHVEIPVCKVANNSAFNSRLLIINSFISNRSLTQTSLKDLSNELHLSEKQVQRVIKQLFHKTFHQLLSETRLCRAARLLVTSDLSISEICERVGYQSYTTFFEAFKREYGMSPSCYRHSRQTQATR